MSSSRHTIFLASSSPRRLELLHRTGYRCVVRVPEVDEAHRPDEPPVDYVLRLAAAKAAAVCVDPNLEPTDVVVAADTVVIHGGEILGKPEDEPDARRILTQLSDDWHTVMTGFVVTCIGQLSAPEVVETAVRFKPLTSHEIDCYVATGEWRDKAGGYGAQGRAAFMVAELRGSYTNIVGLPLAQVVDALCRLGVEPSEAAMLQAPESRA